MTFKPDNTEIAIADVDQAWHLLNNNLPGFQKIYQPWLTWFNQRVSDDLIKQVIIDAVVISYARMALRNGSLSKKKLDYHNEKHIDDLLKRLMSLTKTPSSSLVPSYGWSLLSLFMSCHDLRQSESTNNLDLIGNNEQASYQEVSRILKTVDVHHVIRQEHKELLKLMIHGSTFGTGEDNKGNIYKGNLVAYILKNVGYFGSIDKELAYIACDVDTANVAQSLQDYAQSSLDVYNEIINNSNKSVSAYVFFGHQQEQYFFELQKFNSKLCIEAFDQMKKNNASKIKIISNKIKSLDNALSNESIVQKYIQYVKELS